MRITGIEVLIRTGYNIKVKISVIKRRSLLAGWSGAEQSSTGNKVYWPKTRTGEKRKKASVVGASTREADGKRSKNQK